MKISKERFLCTQDESTRSRGSLGLSKSQLHSTVFRPWRSVFQRNGRGVGNYECPQGRFSLGVKYHCFLGFLECSDVSWCMLGVSVSRVVTLPCHQYNLQGHHRDLSCDNVGFLTLGTNVVRASGMPAGLSGKSNVVWKTQRPRLHLARYLLSDIKFIPIPLQLRLIVYGKLLCPWLT